MSVTADRVGRIRQVRLVLAAVLVVLLAASTAWLVLAVRADDDARGGSDRDAAMLAARSYVQAASNFGPGDLDEQNLLTAYRERVQPLISTAYREKFAQEVDNVTPLAVQGFGTTTTVERVGVVTISPDRATVLVGGETARSVQDKAEEPTGYTLQLSLVKVDDAWLVDQTPCQVAQDPTCEAASQSVPTEAPEQTTPTEQGTPKQQKPKKKRSE